MKVKFISGTFISKKMLVKLTPHESGKKPVVVQINNMDELSEKVREIGAVEVETTGCLYIFREGM